MSNSYLHFAIAQDAKDELRKFRAEFFKTDENLIYLDGNSLGKMPLSTIDVLKNTLEKEWGENLIRSWNKSWYTKNRAIGAKIAGLIGAKPEEIIVADSTSINLYKLAFAALQYRQGRTAIVSDELNFSTDLYVLQGLIAHQFKNHQLNIVASADAMSIQLDDLASAITHHTALVQLSHVAFKSGFMYSIDEVNKLIHHAGALDLWDLSHSVGAVPLELNRWNVSLAIGCTYKYLNGGPGSPAFLYVRKDLHEDLINPVSGWFGAAKPFNFSLEYEAASDISKFLSGTPSILALNALEVSIDMHLNAGNQNIRAKSLLLSQFLLHLFHQKLRKLNFELGSPEVDENRGSHISLKHPEARRICEALIQPDIGNHVVIPDFRSPDNIRIGLTPLYTSFQDIYYAVEELELIVKEKLYEKIQLDSNQVVT